jgi:hypothetical protein
MVSDELQNIDWAGEMRFISYGVRVGVRVNDERILDSLPKHLPPLLKPTNASVDTLFSIVLRDRINRRRMRLHKLFEDDRQIMQMDDVAALLNYFETVVQLYVADNAPRRVFVHAGVVGWQGKAIVIPGRSFSGKTSLVVEFLKAGATYYSDEYAVLDPHGLVHPYPRLLSVRENGAVVGNKRRVEDLGGRVGKTPLPVGLILATKYRAGAHFRPRQLSPGEAILAMFDNTVSARRQPTTALATIKQAISEAQLWKGTRGETAETVAMVLKKFTM